MLRHLTWVSALALVWTINSSTANAQYPYVQPYKTASQQAVNVSQGLPWHNQYYHQAYGEPMAMVVPPNAEYQTHYGWGVGGMRNTPVFHQFGRTYPGDGGFGGYRFRHPPYWPSDTNQFGVYNVRGPW